MKLSDLPHERLDTFYALLFYNGVISGFHLDLETARAKAELESGVVAILRRVIVERIECVESREAT